MMAHLGGDARAVVYCRVVDKTLVARLLQRWHTEVEVAMISWQQVCKAGSMAFRGAMTRFLTTSRRNMFGTIKRSKVALVDDHIQIATRFDRLDSDND